MQYESCLLRPCKDTAPPIYTPCVHRYTAHRWKALRARVPFQTPTRAPAKTLIKPRCLQCGRWFYYISIFRRTVPLRDPAAVNQDPKLIRIWVSATLARRQLLCPYSLLFCLGVNIVSTWGRIRSRSALKMETTCFSHLVLYIHL